MMAAAYANRTNHSRTVSPPNIGQLFLFVSQHEALHGGQLTIANRSLGHKPLLG